MRLDSVHIGEVRGLPNGLEVRFDGQELVLLHGPNGIGKSSLVRLVRVTLWPEGALDWERAETRWTIGGKRWTARLSMGAVGWSCDGVETAPPSLPDASTASSYVLRLPDLLFDREGAGGSFARRIRVELFGGIDLDAIEDATDRPTDQLLSKRRAEVSGARAELDRAEDEIQAAAQSEQRLQEIAAKLDASRDDQARLAALEGALEVRKTERKLSRLEERGKEFPRGLDELHARDLDEAERLEAEWDQVDGERNAALEHRRAAEEKLRRLGVANPGTPTEEDDARFLTKSRAARETLRGLETRLEDLTKLRTEAEVAAREAGLADVEAALGAEEVAGAGESAPDLSHLEDLLRRRSFAEGALAAVTSEIENGDALPEPEGTTDLQEGTRVLRDWLSAARSVSPETPVPLPPPTKTWNRAELALLATGLVAAGIGIRQDAPLALGLGVGVALVILLDAGRRALRARRRGAPPTGVDRTPEADLAAIERRFGSLDLPAPPAWDRGSVEHQLLELDTRLAKALLREQVREEWLRTKPAKEAERDRLRSELQEVIDEAMRLARPFGLEKADLLESFRTLRALDERRRATAHARGTALLLRSNEAEFIEQQERLRLFLEEHGVSVDWDAEDLPRSHSELEGVEAHMQARRGLGEAQRAIETIEIRRAKIDTHRKRFFEARSLGEVPPADRLNLLRERIARLGEWDEFKTQREVLRRKLDDPAHGLDAEIAALSDEELASRITALEESLGALEELREDKGKVSQLLASVRAGAGIEDALAALAEREEALQELEQRNALAQARLKLLSDLRRDLEIEHAPPVLKRADSLLRTFTGGAFELRYDACHGFIAHDIERGAAQPLDELSDGTRAQCLVAVRLASIATSEEGRNLPIFLDEALVLSDDEREKLLVRALLSLAEEATDARRQVFYLTAQASDLRAWQRIAQERGNDFSCVDLGALQGRARAALPEELAAPEVLPIPVPRPDEPIHTYGQRLGVTPLDPRLSMEAADLWHLMLDPHELPLLHRLRLFAIRTIGAWNDRGDLTVEDIDSEQRALLSRRIAAFEVFRDLWLQGRPQPLSTSELFECPALSDTFRDRARTLLLDVEHDARAFVAGLHEKRIKGFRSKQAQDIELWARDRGMIVDAEPLTPDELLGGLRVRLGERAQGFEEELRRLHAQWLARFESTAPRPATAPASSCEHDSDSAAGEQSKEDCVDEGALSASQTPTNTP